MHRQLLASFTVLTLLLSAGVASADKKTSRVRVKIGQDNNSGNNPLVQPGDCETQSDGSLVCDDPAFAGGGRDQSLQFGDILFGGKKTDLQIGGLGSDVLLGGKGDDVQIGGLEHFFPQNRDRAFGGPGSDVFIWKPGDGSDFVSGGSGKDLVVFGNVGEKDGDGVAFGVVADRQVGTVFIDSDTNLPLVDVSGSPGFCEVIDDQSSPQSGAELAELGLDHLVRFTIRGISQSFENGDQDTDNGLRVTLHLNSVEFLACTSADGGSVEFLDLRYSPARPIEADQIPSKRLRKRIQEMIF